ncbi:hypothetical protein K1719_021806 [Acacia pycnantha]|nr:hypothetical protein K1719_021806 [Acacia pycnantha]
MKILFSDVNDSKDTWTVHAKVLRKWVVRRKVAPYYAVWKIGMILIDEELTMIEVSATHKNMIEKWTDEPKEGVVYKFQNFQVLENDDKYRVTTHQWRFNFHTYTYVEESDVDICDEAYNFKSISNIQQRNVTDGGLIDVIGFLQAFGRLQDQMREFDIIKRLNFSIAEFGHLSNAFNATLVTLNPTITEADLLKEMSDISSHCALSQDFVGSQLFTQISSVENPTYSVESLLTFRTRIPLCEIAKIDQECDVVTKVTIQKVETLYGWSYDAYSCDKKPEYQSNGTLRCSKCDKDVLMTVPKYKIHYKVYDDKGKCSIIFFDRHATELLGKSASKVKEDMQEEGRNSTVPEELDKFYWPW